MSRIALIHATVLSLPPINEAFASLWPEADLAHLLDDSLSRDRAAGQETTSRILALAEYAVTIKADAILFSCSAFGEAISFVKRHFEIPVFKPNEAMFESAYATGGHIAMLATFVPSIESMEKEFHESAPKGVKLTTRYVEGAREASDGGDQELHDQLIAETAASLQGFDAIMLAHFSMSNAAARCEEAAGLPVLTAPDTVVSSLKSVIEG